jgi:hypothetical protein
MRPTKGESPVDALFEVIVYQAVSARSLLDETPTYGPLRLLEAAQRTLAAMEAAGIAPTGTGDVRTRLDAAIASVIEGEAGFRDRIDELIMALVQHVEADLK